MKLRGLFIVAVVSLAGAVLLSQEPEVPPGRRGPAVRQISAEELEEMLVAGNREPDAKLAKQLSEVELRERLNPARLSRCEAYLRGPKSTRALKVLADKSAFLDPAAADIPGIAAPNLEAQNKMIALTVKYVTETVHQLPNLYATRVDARFMQDKKPLHWVSTESAIVRYIDGQETFAQNEFRPAGAMMTTGEFGPVLLAALLDFAHGNLTWSHWERGPAALEAVYRYAANVGKSHYEVDGQYPGYRGELTVDPSNGAILRLVMRADVGPGLPLNRADVVVEYGPVELGGKTYICPLRSIALSADSKWWWLNDVVFEQYHLYHASARLLPGSSELR